MAEVAATIANGGTLMQPTFLQEAKDPDGRTIEELDPDEQSNVVSDDTAAELTDMMTHVTEEGTAAGLTVGRPGASQARPGPRRSTSRPGSTGPGSSASRPPTIPRSRSRR